MDLNEIAVFIQVVQAGSFSAAARNLGMPNSTVSHKVSNLERRLGVTLIRRTTRKLQVTPLGEDFYQSCLRGLEEIRGAESELSSSLSEPRGLLRITAPVELGNNILAQLISAFIKKYPKVRVEVILTDRRVDLLGENVDLAIRAGELKDSSLIAKKLGTVTFAAMAAPQYLKKFGTPSFPQELTQHQCIQFTPIGKDAWTLIQKKSRVRIPMSGQMIINDLNMAKALTIAGGGIALLPTFFCGGDVQSGLLVPVLNEWTTQINPVHFVYPAQKFVQPKLSAFMEFTEKAIKHSLLGA